MFIGVARSRSLTLTDSTWPSGLYGFVIRNNNLPLPLILFEKGSTVEPFSQ